jgi:hypothetical protein
VLCQDGRVISASVVLWRRLTAEFLGSAFLAAVVIGGIVAAGLIKALYPAITSSGAAGIIVPRDSAGRAPARAGHDGASPAADRLPGTAQPY